MKTSLHILFTLLPLAAVSCKVTEQPSVSADAPVLVSISPADGTTGITGKMLTVVLSFNQNIRCSATDRAKISIDADAVVNKVFDNAEKLNIEISGLSEGTTYTLNVPDGIITGYKENQAYAKAISTTFSTKEPVIEVNYDRNPSPSLSNGNATIATHKLYKYLLSQYGKKTISGAMGGTAWTTKYTDYIYNECGHYPGIVGFDYLFLEWPAKAWSECPDYSDIAVVKGAWDSGNIIQIGWHWNVPKQQGLEDDPNNYTFYKDQFYGSVFSAKNAVIEGTWENGIINRQINKLAGYMWVLADAGIPVLFRPLHEAAGDYSWGSWFWWGNDGAEACKELWKYLRNKLEKEYRLNNIIWVWTVQTSDAGKLAEIDKMIEWYPGDEYVDMVGADLYVTGGTSQSDVFKRVNNSVKGNKIVALTECGALLDPEKYFAEDAPWAYFMSWEDTIPLSESKQNWTTPQSWRNTLSNSYILNKGDLNGIK